MDMELPFKLHYNTFHKIGRNYLLKILEITKNALFDSFEIEEVFKISTQLNLNEANAHFEELSIALARDYCLNNSPNKWEIFLIQAAIKSSKRKKIA